MVKILPALFATLMYNILFGQTVAGSWSGNLHVQGVSLPLVFHIHQQSDTLFATMDSPAQGATGIAVSHATFTNSKLQLQIPVIGAAYSGMLQGDSMVGTFTQMGRELPLVLRKNPLQAIDRFAKNESPVVLHTNTGDIYGTLTLPENSTTTRVALLIAGSGPTDRDGNSMFTKNNALLMLAQALAKNNIASVRYDKRGVGESTKALVAEDKLRFTDYANDVADWITLLKKDKRFTDITVIGHSEGALIGMIAAATAKANKFISVAGAVEPAGAIIKRQLAGNADAIRITDSIRAGGAVQNVPPALQNLFRPSVQPYLMSWFKYNPQAEIKKLQIPILILQGTNDLQVTMNDAQLLKNAAPKAQLITIQGMNHVLKTVKSKDENIQSYNTPGMPVAPALINAITTFIKDK